MRRAVTVAHKYLGVRLAASLGGKAHTAFKRKLYYEQLEVKQQAQLLQKRDGFFGLTQKRRKWYQSCALFRSNRIRG